MSWSRVDTLSINAGQLHLEMNADIINWSRIDALLVAMAVVAIAAGIGIVRRTDVPMSCKNYVVRVLAGFAAFVIFHLVHEIIKTEIASHVAQMGILGLFYISSLWSIGFLLTAASGCFFTVVLCYWTARRFLDLGKSKWLGFLAGVPLVNFLVIVILCFLRSPAPAQTAVPN